MKKIKLIIFSMTFLALTSCFNADLDIDDLNDNPNRYTDAPIGLLLNHSLLSVASIAEAEPARMTGVFSDQFTGVDRQYANLDNYTLTNGSFDAIWDNFYQRGITQVQIVKEKAIDADNKVIQGQAEILEGYYFAEVALLFGDVPFSEVNDPNITSPKYEEQLLVLNGAISLIDAGLNKVEGSSAANDVFDTNSSWIQIGNALKARYFLAKGDYAEALAAAKAAKFTDITYSWNIKHSTANYAENLFWQFEVEQRGGYLQFNSSEDIEVTSTLNDYLSANNKTYFQTRPGAGTKTVEIARLNYYRNSDKVNYNTTDGFAAVDASFPVISFEEIQLIIAECEQRGGSDSNALLALNLVRQSNTVKFTGSTYSDLSLSDVSGADLLKEILVEKYCSVIGLPTFYDINRTNNLINVKVSKNAKGSTIIPQRFLYPQTELSSNKNFPTTKYEVFDKTPINK